MVPETSTSRRTVIQIVGTLAAVLAGTRPATATRSPRSTHRSAAQADISDVGGVEENDAAGDTVTIESVNGLYEATVDRIVDGEHVVVLLETDGSVVEQFVLPRRRLSTVEEGTKLLVFVVAGHLTVLWQGERHP